MKISFDIDCTPEEARRFLGLPDVSPVHEEAMEIVGQRMTATLKEMDVQEMMRTWLPACFENWQQLQQIFWNQVMGGGSGSGGAGGGPSGDKPGGGKTGGGKTGSAGGKGGG